MDKIKKTFMRFLKETNSYNNFIDNMNGKYVIWDRDLNSLFKNKNGEQIIDSFDWSETKQGCVYWMRLHHIWGIHIMPHIKKLYNYV